MRRWLLVALLAAAAADIVGVEPESFDRRAQLRGDDEELERDKVQATLLTADVGMCPTSFTTSPENGRTLNALRTATLTTLHVGAARAMWCASVRRTTMCCTTSGGRSMSNFGAIARRLRA